jgi:hypothetical protein
MNKGIANVIQDGVATFIVGNPKFSDSLAFGPLLDFIKGSYNDFTRSTQIPDYIADPDWHAPQEIDFYTNVLKPYCRSCHIAMSGNSGLNFEKHASYVNAHNAYQDQNVLLIPHGRQMPNSSVAFRRFWLKVEGGSGPDYFPSYHH